MTRVEKLKSDCDCGIEDFYNHFDETCTLRLSEMRTSAQAILDWVNHSMNEDVIKQLAAPVDPFGAPVDKRGM
jgi:hypothetical protein